MFVKDMGGSDRAANIAGFMAGWATGAASDKILGNSLYNSVTDVNVINGGMADELIEGGRDALKPNVQSKFEHLLSSDYYKHDFGYDCSEIAEDFYDIAGKQGTIYHIEGKKGVINGYEYNHVVDYVYHEVYSDGLYL